MTQIRSLDELSRSELAVLVREYLLAGQLMDRAGMPHLISRYGRDEMGQIAIEEWMGSSPIYTRRVQKLLGYEGDTISTMFKGLQLDIGAPPEFMDFRLQVNDDHHGEFWLDHCGALMDVEPMGDEYVVTMCHTIEDPTFDATAIATHRKARIRPIHRPPRAPADRHPHCHWTATIDPDVEDLPDPTETVEIMRTTLARSGIADIVREGEGWHDYAAPMDADLRTEFFSKNALVELAREVAVQSHLLTMALLASVRRRHGDGESIEIGAHHFAGSAGLTSERIRDALGLERSVAGLAQVIALHPAFQPRWYVEVAVEFDEDAETLRLALLPCEAAVEPEQRNWISLLAAGEELGTEEHRIKRSPIVTLVQGVDPHYRAERIEPADGEIAAWAVTRSEEAEKESSDVSLTRFSTGSSFEFSETPVELTLQ